MTSLVRFEAVTDAASFVSAYSTKRISNGSHSSRSEMKDDASFHRFRKEELVKFACRTRQLFIRILAVVKWAATAGKVNACEVGTALRRMTTYGMTLSPRISNISWSAVFDSYVKRQTLWRNLRVKNFSMLGKSGTGVERRHFSFSVGLDYPISPSRMQLIS